MYAHKKLSCSSIIRDIMCIFCIVMLSFYFHLYHIFVFYVLFLVSDATKVKNGAIICFRYLPNKSNRQMWRLEKEINSKISKLIKQRQEETHEQDLLQMILEGAKNCEGSDGLLSDSISCDVFMIDNCKNIFFAGHETTAITASWCLMLLAAHQDWQDRARAEVLEVCGKGAPDASMLRSLKTVCCTPYVLKLNVSMKHIKLINSLVLGLIFLDFNNSAWNEISIQRFRLDTMHE